MRYVYLPWLVALAAAIPLTLDNRDSNNPKLQFNSDRKFSIIVFSDLHLGESPQDKGPEADRKTIGVMNSILDYEKPNMVVLNGDLVTCDHLENGYATPLIDQITAPLVDRSIPFAATFGNHDMSTTCSTRDMSEQMWNYQGDKGQRLSFNTSSVPGPYNEVGTSNYYVPIYSSDGLQLALMLYFFDGKGGPEFKTGDAVPQIVDDKVSNWFRNTRTTLNALQFHYVPSLAFVHIPFHAALAMQKGFDGATAPGLKDEQIDHQDAKDCDKSGNCKYDGLDKSFMSALVHTEGLRAVFSGHCHGIDWCTRWSHDLANKPANGKGLDVCFNRHSGYGGYSNWARGARQIVIEESRLVKNDIDTWIRLEDGSISGSITLNDTFGTDRYSPIHEWETWLHSS